MPEGRNSGNNWFPRVEKPKGELSKLIRRERSERPKAAKLFWGLLDWQKKIKRFGDNEINPQVPSKRGRWRLVLPSRAGEGRGPVGDRKPVANYTCFRGVGKGVINTERPRISHILKITRRFAAVAGGGGVRAGNPPSRATQVTHGERSRPRASQLVAGPALSPGGDGDEPSRPRPCGVQAAGATKGT